jgi:hypothetical protein
MKICGKLQNRSQLLLKLKNEMPLGWTRLKKTRRINRESSTRLESIESTKTWETKKDMEKIRRRGNRRKRKYQERCEEVGSDRTKWKNFTPALYSERTSRR